MSGHRQIPRAPHTQINMNFNFNCFASDWQVPVSYEHPFVAHIRKVVLEYRIQSASHFNITIEVAQAMHDKNPPLSSLLHPSFLPYVGFYNFGTAPIIALCRPRALPSGKKQPNMSSNSVEVLLKDKFVPLARFLGRNFPKYKTPVGAEALGQWWQANGKTFNWTGLPTELKERIVQFCMHRSELPPLSKKSMYRTRGPHEVTAHLGSWSALLRVSHQVRAISLRLCLAGSSDLKYDKGLCIFAEGGGDLKNAIRRLTKFPQLLQPNNASIATDEKTSMLINTYKYFPKIYPHLERFATFGHGIRKVCIRLSFIDTMHFFKVETAGFAQYRKPCHIDFEVFERLPHLNQLIIFLPGRNYILTDMPRQQGPPIFGDEPCPRILHRLIYERAAEVLAKYPFVTLLNFMDEIEELRYKTLRKEAMNSLRFSEKDLSELYTEDGGGIELEESVWPGVYKKNVGQVNRAFVFDSFWPPQCRCQVRCKEIF
ncbi:hypothetical protein Ptr902_13489 [Pyrenophora tritici-repentis]|nr:hypothetical protein Ptr902_13489 [Pyrenophora tritici-repentis]